MVTCYPKKAMKKLRVGDRVRFRFGGRVATGKVIEDRGQIASKGGQLVRVKLETANPDDANEVEIAARDVASFEHSDTKRARRGPPRLATSH
jgi:hypothetical protein